MAVLRFHTAVNMNTLQPFYGDVTTANASTIVVEDGSNRAVYTGSFSYNADGDVFGTIQGIDLTVGGQHLFTASSLNNYARLFQSYIDRGDVDGLFRLALDGADTLYGSEGADAISAYGGADRIEAGDGEDHIAAGSGNDTILAGTGADYLDGEDGNDLLFGGQGDYADWIFGGFGNDAIYAGGGDDQVAGEWDNDLIGGGHGSDDLSGGDGDDTIFGGGGADTDWLAGGAGKDRIFAGAGNDGVDGGDGDDEIGAGAGADVVTAGAGNDIIYLGANDGAADLFRSVANNGNDTVWGFENGTDHLDLRASGFTNFGQIQAALGTSADGSATITLAAGQVLTLEGVTASQIDASDFMF